MENNQLIEQLNSLIGQMKHGTDRQKFVLNQVHRVLANYQQANEEFLRAFGHLSHIPQQTRGPDPEALVEQLDRIRSQQEGEPMPRIARKATEEPDVHGAQTWHTS